MSQSRISKASSSSIAPRRALSMLSLELAIIPRTARTKLGKLYAAFSMSGDMLSANSLYLATATTLEAF